MKHSFGVWTLVALVVGNAVGAGIYTTSGFALNDLGSPQWVVLAWFVAGLIALMGALSYAMLVRDLTESGGEYLFLSRSIHPIAGFIAGWISLLAGFPGAIAFSATAFELYARSGVSSLAGLPNDLLAVSVILLAGGIHIVRVRFGARVHEWIVLLMLIILVALIVVSGALFWSRPELPVVDQAELMPFNLLAFANSLVWISLSYAGFNAAAYVAGEVHDAKRVVPKGMIVGTLLTMVLCVVINVIIVYSAAPEFLRNQPDVTARAAEAIGGIGGRRIVELVIAVSLLTSITAMVLAGPRVYAKMADDGALPRLFQMKQGQPPRASIVLQVLTALILVLVADLRGLINYLGLTLSLCLALAVSSLFVQHWRHGRRPESVWYPVAPVIFVVCTVGFAVLTAIRDPVQFLAALPTLILGAVVYLGLQAWRRMRNV